MKYVKHLINLLFIACFIFTTAISCDKTDDPGGDGQSAGTLKDADGNSYNTVKIGTQVWMKENLKTTKYNDGSNIPNVTDNSKWDELTSGAYCNYDNLEKNADTYGRLYNWYALNTGKLAPAGWHVPTDADCTILEEYLMANGFNFDGTTDRRMFAKAMASKTNWKSSEEEGSPGFSPENNNSSGFSALPGGKRTYRGFESLGETGIWWTYDEVEYESIYCILIDYEDKYFSRLIGYDLRADGYSVRLIKD